MHALIFYLQKQVVPKATDVITGICVTVIYIINIRNKMKVRETVLQAIRIYFDFNTKMIRSLINYFLPLIYEGYNFIYNKRLFATEK